jgi:hypothetical protein
MQSLNQTNQIQAGAGTDSSSPWSACFMAFGVWVLSSFAVSAAPMATASVEPEEIRPGSFATFVITIEDGVPDDPEAPLRLPQGLAQTTQVPAYGMQTTSVNGARIAVATLTWQLRCEEIGEYTIPAQELMVRGVKVRTNPVKLVAKENPAQPSGKFDPIMTLEVGKREFYIGELVPITVNLYIHRHSLLRRVGLIELPKDGLAVQRFPLQGDESMIMMNGNAYRALAYNSTVSALKLGKFTLGPATSEILIEIPPDDRRLLHPLFNQSEPRKVRPTCNAIEINVLPLPTEGVPQGFNNLAGDFSLTMTAEPHEVALNDPIAVEMTITGTGNFDAITAPAITDPDSWKTYPARRYNVQSSDNPMDGTQRSIGFSQVIIPKKNVSVIPPFELSYFSPTKKQYVTLRTGAVPIVVNASEQAAPPSSGATASTSGTKGGPDLSPGKVPTVKPEVTDILAVTPERPVWLMARPTLWADPRFRQANYLAGGVLLLLILGKIGLGIWRSHVNSPLAPTRRLLRQMQASHLSRARFYELAAAYVATQGLTGEKVQSVLDRHHQVNFGKATEEAEHAIPRDERNQMLSALGAA